MQGGGKEAFVLVFLPALRSFASRPKDAFTEGA